MNHVSIQGQASAGVDRSRDFGASLAVGGIFGIECYDADGNLKWASPAKNGVVDAAINNVLDVYLRSQAQTSNWYLGLIDNAGYSALASSDTMASHAGWAESTAYSNANRVTWTPTAAASKAIANVVTSDFNINAPATIRGVFLTSANDKGGTTGNIFATAAFSAGNQTVASGDTLKVTYTVSAVSG
jgi:hypothetical protein